MDDLQAPDDLPDATYSKTPKADQALTVSEQQFWAFVTATSDVVYQMSADWQQMHQLVGKSFLPDTTTANASWLEQYIPPESQPQVLAVIKEAITERKPFELVHRVIRADGSLGWTFSRAIPMLNEQGEITEWFGTASDITERKRAEEVQRQSDEKYRRLFETINTGFTLCQAIRDEAGNMIDYRFLELNPAFEKLTGLVAQDVVGKTILEVMPGLDAWWIDTYQHVVDTHQAIRFEKFLPQLDRWYDLTAFYYGNDQFAAYYDDITQRKRAQEQQTYLLTLSDALRPLTDPVAIQIEASTLLGKHLRASRVLYIEVESDGDSCVIHRDYVDGVFSVAGRYSLSTYEAQARQQWLAGQTVSYADVETDESLVADQRAAIAAAQVRAWLGVPLLKGGRLVVILAVHQSTPRSWLAGEIGLVAETVERTWAAVERARAEEALRKSEEKFRLLGVASSDSIYRMSPDWTQMHHLIGKSFLADTTHPNSSWLDGYIPLEDQSKVQQVLQEAIRTRSTFELEHRVLQADGTVGWTFSRAIPVLDEQGDIQEWLGAASDITARKQAQEALRQSEEKFRSLFTSIDEGYALVEVIYDEGGKPVDLLHRETNPAYQQQSGLGDLANRPFRIRELVPDLEQWWFNFYAGVVRTGEAARAEYHVAELGRWYTVYASRVGGAGSHKVAAVFDDITERKRAEANLAFLNEAGQDLAQLTNIDQTMNGLGEKIAAYLGLSACVFTELQEQAQIGVINYGWPRSDITSLLGTYRMDKFVAPEVLRLCQTGETVIIRDVFEDPRINGEQYAALNIGSFVSMPLVRNGEWRFLLVVYRRQAHNWGEDEIDLLRELTSRIWTRLERARAEEALYQSEARQRAVLESAKDYAIFTTDLARRVTSWNRGAQALFGYAEDDILHQSVDVLYTPEDRQQQAPQYEAQKATREGRAENERWHSRADGSRFYGSGVVTPLRDAAGSIIGLLKVMRDLTAQKQAEGALREADQRKDEFLAMLAHELRNPMSTIRSGLQILTLTDGKDETSRATLAMMNRQTDHLVRLVDDLLDVSRISQGKIELKRERLELGSLVSAAVEAIRPQFDASQKSLRLRPAPSALFVDGDATRLTQVVTNLLTNGLRYTDKQGQIWIHLAEADGEVLLKVSDNGIGLSQSQLTSIFELFVQADNSLARSMGGLGVGLTLAKRLVELHQGRLEADSPGPGQGSTFTMYLPLAEVPENERLAEDVTASLATKLRVLVIDDNADAALTLSMLLTLKGYEVHSRPSGREGIQAAESLRPAVILCDIGMPELDGYATCRLIRGQSWGQSMRLIALTGYGGADDKQLAREAGFDGHLVKPVDLGALQALLMNVSPTR